MPVNFKAMTSGSLAVGRVLGRCKVNYKTETDPGPPG